MRQIEIYYWEQCRVEIPFDIGPLLVINCLIIILKTNFYYFLVSDVIKVILRLKLIYSLEFNIIANAVVFNACNNYKNNSGVN